MWSKFKSFLMKLLPGMKSALPILLIVVFILVNVAIWWAGPWLIIEGKKPLNTFLERGLCSLIFSLFSFALWGWWQWRRLKAYQKAADREEQLKVDPLKAVVERQEHELNEVMTGLKDSLNTRRYLYTLPWYLVLGLENAGKTSLINRTGQQFVFSTLQRAAGKKSANHYAFDWWIGDESVLIDPDGELLTQGQLSGDSNGEMERRLWFHFIEWLEKTRSRRPLNGVVLALDFSDILSASVSERKAYAHIIRARLKELMDTITTRLPIYITLTKLDLLLGFEPFFRHFTKSEREGILGFTFTLDSVGDPDCWLNEFDQEFSAFISRINDCLPRTLLQCRDDDERAAIYSFSRQIAGAHEILKVFFTDALVSNQFSTSALVRGVYLTSVYQQGVPENAFVDNAARRYGLQESINAAQKNTSSVTFFTKALFNKIIYPEAGLASDNIRVTRHKRRLMILSLVVCSIASVMLLGGWHRYYLLNSQQTDTVLNKVSKFEVNYNQSSFDQLANGILPPLNTIRSATLEFGFFREKSKYFSDLGLYQGHIIGPKVEESYLALLAYRFMPALLQQAVNEMMKAPDGSDEKLSLLRVVRMMVDKSGRQNHFITDYFSNLWQLAYEGDREMQQQLMEHLHYALEHVDLEYQRNAGVKEAVAVLAPYGKLIEGVQQELSLLPVEQRVYRNLKQSAPFELGADIDLKFASGPSYELVFESPADNSENHLLIPRLLTKQGFKGYFIPKSDSVTELALIDSWVLGNTESIDFSEADKQVLRNKIRNLYVNDYISSWRKALNSIEILHFNDVSHGTLILENLATNGKPLNRLMEILVDNTAIFPKLPEDDEAKQALLASTEYKIADSIDSNFTDLTRMLEKGQSNQEYINEVMQYVAQVHIFLKAVQDAPDEGKAALRVTEQRLNLSDADAIYALERIASSLPQPLDSIMLSLAQESWRVVLQSAVRQLEIRWYNDVYMEYQQKLAARYPFSPAAGKQVSLADFEQFFGPQGTLSEFYADNLKMFIEENYEVVARINAGQDSLISNKVLNSLARFEKIQQAFFNRQGSIDVQFTLQPLAMSANKRRSVINVDGQFIEYTHGPSRNIELVWPNTLRASAESKLTLVPSAANLSPRSFSYQGPWAFFRLLDKARIIGSSATSVDYQFQIDNGEVAYRLHAQDNNNPFTSQLLRGFTLPETLY